jgi:transcriptional regulator with XRE-family HTH domain
MGTKSLISQLQYIDEAHEMLGLTWRQLAGALGADESTLHRWRSGESEPRAVYVSRMEALKEFQTELFDAMRPEPAREWLNIEVPSLGGRRPIDLLMEGNIEPLTRIMMRLNMGSLG